MASDDLLVAELFYSIQGESTFAGLPCVFIRLAGCNLRCTYCDARYSYDEPGLGMGYAEIVAYTAKYPDALVEITGGEPLIQANTITLANQLIEAGRTLLLETNGSLPIAPLPLDCHVIVDVKCPGSGSHSSFELTNLAECRRRNRLRPGFVELKFVLQDIDDYRWARDFVHRHELITVAPLLFSPVRYALSISDLAQLILDDQLQVRLHPQLHTLIWPDKLRGA